MAAVGGISILLLQALFFIREVLLYVFLYGMPIGLGITYGNVPVVSSVAKRICAQFVPLAILPLPAAVLFRGYEFLFTGGTRLPVSESFLQYLVVISLPLLALYVTWKTFTYASPAAARVLGTAGRGTVMLGTAAGAAYLGKPVAAMIASTRGPRAAVGAAAARRYATQNTSRESRPEMSGQRNYDYRRTENDPQYP
jgi:type IV secretion system protein TrbL